MLAGGVVVGVGRWCDGWCWQVVWWLVLAGGVMVGVGRWCDG